MEQQELYQKIEELRELANQASHTFCKTLALGVKEIKFPPELKELAKRLNYVKKETERLIHAPFANSNKP